MRGTAYGVGVGPGDPELMTLKAVRLIRENQVIAVPVTGAGRDRSNLINEVDGGAGSDPADKAAGEMSDPRESVAYRIALQAVPELAEKEVLAIEMPMTKDPEKLRRMHEAGAASIAARLDEGENVIFLTLGDTSVYCTFTYLQEILEAEGYKTELVSGIPSFCAAAARLNIPLVKGSEPLHVLPGVYAPAEAALPESGTVVIMKSGNRLAEVKQMLKDSGRDVKAVMNCGMPNEQVFRSAEELPDAGGYFTLIIAR